MAYSLNQRFPPSPSYFRLLDPGSYQNTNSPLIKCNKAAFLSNTERNIQSGAKIWTHTIYSSDIKPHIPNCTAMTSKIPRFSYETNNLSTIEELLCQCNEQNVCDCESDNRSTQEVICQGKVRRTIYIGPPPRSNRGNGISAPSKRDKGFVALADGSTKRVYVKENKDCPPFYNTDVNAFTDFYKGCKWSHRTAKISKISEDTPGPAHYTLDHEPNIADICAEKVRFSRRKASKQLRFIEMVQRRNILDNLPGPSTYRPKLIKGTDLNFLGPKTARFSKSKLNIEPGPADHSIKRDFDLPKIPSKLCQAPLPESAAFGSRAVRLKPTKDEGPSAASYNPTYKPCQFNRYIKAPFLTSTNRFKEVLSDSDDDFEQINGLKDNSIKNKKFKFTPTWQFKSKTVRMKPLKKDPLTSVCTDIQPTIIMKRLLELQHSAPFFSSEARFQTWYNWIPVHAREKTPGPSDYNPDKVKCYPAVRRGPLSRSPRFRTLQIKCPAPNQYNIGNGLETVLNTHNERLKSNLEKQHKFHWEPPNISRTLNNDEKETLLLSQSIALLDAVDVFDNDTLKSERYLCDNNRSRSKILRCFVSR